MSVLAVVLSLLSGACGGGSLVPHNAGGTGHIGGDASRDVIADVSVGVDAGAVDVARDAIVDAGADAAAEVGSNPIYCGGGVYCFGTDLCVIRSLSGCSGPDCASPDPFCAPRPDACANGVSCACLSPTLCPASACGNASGRVAFCAIEDAPPDELACGPALTCHGTDLCVTLNLCGGPQRCDAVPDGGQCPAGSTLNSSCPGGEPGCMPDCPGPTFSCAPRPAACAPTLDCNCVGSSFCPSSGCVIAGGRAVFCANE